MQFKTVTMSLKKISQDYPKNFYVHSIQTLSVSIFTGVSVQLFYLQRKLFQAQRNIYL